MSLTTALVILAGGAGKRLGGVVKPLLRDQIGVTLIEHQLSKLGRLADDVVVVAPQPLWTVLEPVIQPVPLLADAREGPAVAVVSAADAMTSDRLLVVGGDTVRFEVTLAESMLAMIDETIDAVVPVVEERRQPMFAVYRRTAILAARGARSMHRLLETMHVREVDGRNLEDVDDEADAERLGLRFP